MHHIKIMEGDITSAPVDAIVNAANPQLLGGGGVDGAIHRAAGPALLRECERIPAENGVRCAFGHARITGAGQLPARYVIHAVGPIYQQEQDPQQVLASAYNRSLALALANDCQSIAFPAISCGVYGYPHQAAARLALTVCGQEEYASLAILFYLFGAEMTAIWLAEYQRLAK